MLTRAGAAHECDLWLRSDVIMAMGSDMQSLQSSERRMDDELSRANAEVAALRTEKLQREAVIDRLTAERSSLTCAPSTLDEDVLAVVLHAVRCRVAPGPLEDCLTACIGCNRTSSTHYAPCDAGKQTLLPVVSQLLSMCGLLCCAAPA